jgi:hypothetical protein
MLRALQFPVCAQDFLHCIRRGWFLSERSPGVRNMLVQLHWLRVCHIHGEVELPTLLAAARRVVEAAEVVTNRGHVQAGFFLDLAD